MCQKARVIVQRGGSTAYSETSGTRSHWRGGNRDDRSQATTTTKFEERFDIFQIQKLLARNPDLAQVVSTDPNLANARVGGCNHLIISFMSACLSLVCQMFRQYRSS